MSDAERLDRVEECLSDILSELDADGMGVDERVTVELSCQRIYAAFGGERRDGIYRREGGQR